jgi:SAM-dependent methyltransferase
LPLVRRLRALFRGRPELLFDGSARYWRERYSSGGDSGIGSYGKFAQFKARVLNALFVEFSLSSAIEFGCGDGNQLKLLYIRNYVGVDISPDAIKRCRETFTDVPGRRFVLEDHYTAEQADCALSLDVIYHLVEDTAFDAYMRRLFASALRCVVIYSSDRDDGVAADGPHVRHRRFTAWVAQHQADWTLVRHVPNEFPFRGDWRTGSFADFYIYRPAANPQ